MNHKTTTHIIRTITYTLIGMLSAAITTPLIGTQPAILLTLTILIIGTTAGIITLNLTPTKIKARAQARAEYETNRQIQNEYYQQQAKEQAEEAQRQAQRQAQAETRRQQKLQQEINQLKPTTITPILQLCQKLSTAAQRYLDTNIIDHNQFNKHLSRLWDIRQQVKKHTHYPHLNQSLQIIFNGFNQGKQILDSPGAPTTTFTGGGFGLKGATQGMAISYVLNGISEAITGHHNKQLLTTAINHWNTAIHEVQTLHKLTPQTPTILD